MGSNNYYGLFIMVFSVQFITAQSIELHGQLIANNEVEDIYIINKTANKFTISTKNGLFAIPVRLNDTLLFSGISYQPKEIIITKLILVTKQCTVYLEELVNALDEVVVGKVLTGDLMSDINNAEFKRDINFYDLGIPGYTGKPKTQSERRLYDADHGKYMYYIGLAVSINVNKILNKISGKTKTLQHRVYLETKDKCIGKTKSNLSKILFSAHPLEEHYRNEFFYFCADDTEFDSLCIINDDFKTLEFLKQKLLSFKMNLQTKS